MKRQFTSVLAVIAAVAMLSLTTFATGESLEETGGYVPTAAPGLAFKNITLADLGTTVFPSVSKGGGWAGGEARVPLILRTEETSGDVLTAVSYQAQWVDGTYLKCATIRFTNGEGGVYAQTVAAKYTEASIRANYLTDFSGTAGDTAASSSANGYGFCNLKLHQSSSTSLKSINVNFNYSQATKVFTTDAVGISDYAVGGRLWDQMNGTRGNTLPSVTVIGTENSEEFYASSSSKVLVSDTNGAWGEGTYTAQDDIRYGYIDENGYPTPKVTVCNIPFEHYRVVFYGSGDSSDAQFGYVTVNGVNYTSTNTGKAESGEFQTVVGTDSWGKSKVTGAPVNGVNCLVTPITSARTLTVIGHKISGTERGCIAAIQIIRVDEVPENEYCLELTGDVTWSNLTDFTGSADKIIYINNNYGGATVTFDVAVQASLLVVTGSGITSLKFSAPLCNQIGSFYFAGVTGEVAIDDTIQSSTFTPPASGTLRLKGSTTLTAIPFGEQNIGFSLVVDQPMSITPVPESGNQFGFFLKGSKTLFAFDGDNSYEFVKLVLGNEADVTQHVEQRGGTITVTGSTEPGANTASILLGHWNSTSTLDNKGGTFNALNATTRLGWNGGCSWTIGDGESGNDTAQVNLKGVESVAGGAVKSKASSLTLRTGGTLTLGLNGINLGTDVPVALSGGTLATSAACSLTSAKSVTLMEGSETIFNMLEGNDFTVGVALSGSGSLTKTGSGMLTLSASATSTGTLTVNAGTLVLGDGVTWAGTISVGANGTLDITDADVSESETVYIPVGGMVTLAEGAKVKLNGVALNTNVWELSGGRFVNKTLNTAVTTATGDFAFSTATWVSAIGSGMTIDWSGYLSEVRVHANNAAPATATVDVDAANVATFAADGSGDMTFVADNGGITADAYDFSSATGRVEYRLPTGSAAVTSGSDTVLPAGGSGAPTVAAGQTLTLGPWGATEDSVTWTYTPMLRPAAGSTMVFAPGEGKRQKLAGGFGDTNTGTTIGVTNGMLVVDMAGGGDSVFFGANSVRIDNGGILSLEAQDALGYNNARNLTINKGGVLSVKVRDTLKRTVTLNGGTIELQGANSNRALDFFNSNIITVTDDSTIQAINDGSVSNPVIWFRGGTTVINIDDNKTLANNVTYESTSDGQSKGAVTIRGTLNQSTGNGVMQMNGFGGNPLTFVGTATIGESGKPVIYELNCEHQNGTYVVNSGSRFKGTGSVIGNGGVTLAASNSKLCGSLTVNNLAAASGGTYGDQWNAVSAKVSTSYFAAGTQTIQNGSFTIGANCVVTNANGVADTTDASFTIAADGNLILEKAVAVGGLTVADGGTITLSQATVGNTTALTVDGTMTQSGVLNIVLRYGTGIPMSVDRIPLIAATGLNLANVTLDAGGTPRGMKLVYENGVLYCVPKGGFFLKMR